MANFLDNLGFSSIFKKNQLIFGDEKNRRVLFNVGSCSYGPIVLILRKYGDVGEFSSTLFKIS